MEKCPAEFEKNKPESQGQIPLESTYFYRNAEVCHMILQKNVLKLPNGVFGPQVASELNYLLAREPANQFCVPKVE